MGSVLGRIALLTASLYLGYVAGIIAIPGPVEKGMLHIAAFIGVSVFSVFSGYGIFLLPLVFLSAIGYVIWQWPLRYCLVTLVLAFLNTYWAA